jgi:hypothetical protein
VRGCAALYPRSERPRERLHDGDERAGRFVKVAIGFGQTRLHADSDDAASVVRDVSETPTRRAVFGVGGRLEN